MRISSNLALVASLQFGIGSRYDCHVYAIRTAEGVILIDSGSGAATSELIGNTETEFPDQPIVAVILTHSHPDHACGAAKIHQTTQCRVLCPSTSLDVIRNGDEESSGLRQARETGMYPDTVQFIPCPTAEPYSESTFMISGHPFTAIRVRGHSDDSHCLFTEIDGKRTLFCGDVLFYGAVFGVINQPDSGMQGYQADLSKLADLKIDSLLPSHGVFTLSRGQRHIDLALEQLRKGLIPRQIGQFDLIF